MNRKVKSKIQPKLRFPEFIGADGWYETELGQCLMQHPDYGVNAPAVPYDADLPTYLRITDISEEGQFLADQKMSVDEKKVTDDSYLEEGDIVLARTGASVGKSYRYRIEDGKLVFAGFLIRVRPDPRKLNSELLGQFLNTSQYWRWVNFTSTRSGQPGINGNEYSSMPLLLPSTLKEQQKIADCLSSLDDVISAQSQKLEALKDHKKGLMQQLFPAEGETVPKLRFKDFEDDWAETTLGSVAAFINGRAYKQEELLDDGKYRVLRVGNFFTNNEWYYSNLELEPDKYCEAGDLLYAWSASFGPRIWMGEKTIYHYHIWKVVNNEDIDKRFLFVLLNYETEKMKALSANGFALLHITKGTIENWRCEIPKSKKEQQKIAECLTSIDELITAQIEKIEALKGYKKGLMQSLFPNLDEI